jgi:histidyl-tRNA synthetase
MQSQALPGFRDFYPEDFALRAHIFETWRSVAARYGFQEYDGPPLEPLELYTAKSGDEIVGQLYNFQDKGDREVALRPEMTPTLARMVAARANGLKKPIRWFSIPQLFRYERQQRGRLREHFQLNCDLIGEPGPVGDAEIIALAIDVMRAFGLTERDVRVRISDRRVLTALIAGIGISEEWYPLAFAAIDRSEKSRPEEIARWILEEKRAGLTREQIDQILAIPRIKGLPAVEDALRQVPQGDGVASALRDTLTALESMGLGEFIDVDLTIVRGLAYYTGTVFELFDAGKTLRAICGGGRYDNLLSSIGGVDLPALGFGMGDVVLGELLKDRGLVPTDLSSIDVFVAGIDATDAPHLLSISHELRDAGFRVEYALAPQALGKQLKLADARRARLAIVAGGDERARGEVMLKDLSAKSQRAIKRDALVSEVKQVLNP